MTIEKTYKLTIKDTAYFVTEEEVTKLYEQCRKALNIDNANPYFPNYPPGVRKFDDDKTTPLNPTTPSIPYPYDTYPWYTPKHPNDTGYPYWTSPNTTTTCGTINAGSPATTGGTTSVEGNYVMDTYWHTNAGTNQKSTTNKTGINFLSEYDLAAINDNKKWRSSVEQALDKLNADKKV
jgi:hypothetical protein